MLASEAQADQRAPREMQLAAMERLILMAVYKSIAQDSQKSTRSVHLDYGWALRFFSPHHRMSQKMLTKRAWGIGHEAWKNIYAPCPMIHALLLKLTAPASLSIETYGRYATKTKCR